MNKFEKLIYDLVKSNPSIKTFLRNSYQNFFDFFPSENYKTSYPIINKKGYFYGFHDHTPFSSNEKYLLAQKAPEGLFMPNTDNSLKIGFFSGKNFSKFNLCTSTRTWNWHMGCKLQWIGNSNTFIYNGLYKNEGVSKTFNIETNKEEIIDCQLSSISNDGKYFVGYDFFSLEKYMPGYGYRRKNTNYSLNNESMEIYLYDLKNNTKKIICSINDLKDLNYDKTMNDAYHFITHGLFSPCSKKFCFLHRWIVDKSDVRQRKSRLVICDIKGNIISILPTIGMFSHFCWRNKNQLVGYCKTNQFQTAYHLFTLDNDSKCKKVEKFTNLLGDGHPNFNKNGNLMTTDSYPNANRMQSLYVHDFDKNKTSLIGKFYMPKKFQSKTIKDHWCVDLHPRLNKSGTKVCFDNAFSGVRSLAIIDLK
tara:strand:- start:9680 stop:10939 length:1260 start_codon:yes stop_codon:yes gene_type:complete